MKLQALKYSEYEDLFRRKQKSAEFKRIWKDCRLYDRGDHFEITHDLFDGYDSSSSPYVRRFNEVPLATVSVGDVITLTFEDTVDQTVCNRMSSIVGHAVGLNKSDYRNYEQHVRVYYGSNWKDNKPYFAGMRFQLQGDHSVLLNERADKKKVVDTAVVSKATKAFASLRKLCNTTVRMGAFDEFANEFMMHTYLIQTDTLKDPSTIDLDDPTFEDARVVVAFGSKSTIRPDMAWFDPVRRQYVKRDADTVRREWLARCVNNGLAMLRREYYKAHHGYVHVTC
jgi:hypothetical protein